MIPPSDEVKVGGMKGEPRSTSSSASVREPSAATPAAQLTCAVCGAVMTLVLSLRSGCRDARWVCGECRYLLNRDYGETR